jgi:hypothetical protein
MVFVTMRPTSLPAPNIAFNKVTGKVVTTCRVCACTTRHQIDPGKSENYIEMEHEYWCPVINGGDKS